MDAALDLCLPKPVALVKTTSIVASMVASIALFSALAFWDEERESQAALDDFTQEQATLAVSLSSALLEKLEVSAKDDSSLAPERILTIATGIERPGAVRVFLKAPGRAGFVSSDGGSVQSKALEAAAATHLSSVRLTRPEAAELALPARMAIAGFSSVSGFGGSWTIAVVATARAERDREVRARGRLAFGVIVTSGLVLAFGGLAMRKQRKELELAHQLAITTLRTERNERLIRADKLATMGALATGIAHEVSTPLGVILGRAEQLLPKQSDDRSRNAVEAITSQIERINVIIRGFLTLARGGQPALENSDPSELARTAMELVAHRFDAARVELASEVPKDLPKVPCDPRLFEQVLVNLLLNACDACSEGGKVTLSVRAIADRVQFVVNDNGVGIPAEVAERVTEPFFTTKPAGKGTGLGLAIANEIVKHHCGTLTLQPRSEGRGTSATVELPIAYGGDHE